MNRRLALATVLAFAPSLYSQGQVTTYSPGCNGSPVRSCLTAGSATPSAGKTRVDGFYAYPATNTTGAAIQVIAVELYTRNTLHGISRGSLAIHADNSGMGSGQTTTPALAALGLGFMTHGPTASWREGALSPAAIIPPGAVFWIVHECYSGNQPSEDTSSPTGSPAMIFDPGQARWVKAGFQAAFRIRCTSAIRPVLTLGGTTIRSKIKMGFDLFASQGTPGSGALLLLSLRPRLELPALISLQRLGAPGCFVLPGFDLWVPMPLDSTGSGFVSVRASHDPRVRDVAIFAQVIAPARGANPLGLTVSNSLAISLQ